MILLIDKDTM